MSDEFPDPHCLIVADGDVLIRNTLAEYVRNCGYKVFEAATSDEVMLALEEGTVKIDALLADAELSGGFNALELRNWVRDHYPGVEIVLSGTKDGKRVGRERGGEKG